MPNTLAGKRCLLRVNLDIKTPEEGSLRLEAIRPTILFLLKQGATITILSHRGRPAGRVDEALSLEPLVTALMETVGQPLEWHENLRFDAREEENDDTFARELAARGDVYVNDDFASSHRANASLVAITRYVPSYAGLLLEREMRILSRVRDNPQRPLVIIIGGVKIADKLGVVEHFAATAGNFLLGSYYDATDVATAHISRQAHVLLPLDSVDGEGKHCDIGPETVKKFSEIIASAKTVIWNGPLGLFEDERYRAGSRAIAEAVIASGAFSVIGGGDTEHLLRSLGLADRFSFISTGGGAMLDFLAGKKLPALAALER